MLYFYDTEFIENGETIDLISIGVVSEDGREFYTESLDADLSKASPWVVENVITHLWSRQPDKRSANLWTRDGGKGGLLSRQHIRAELLAFCDPEKYGKPEFWGYYSAYDHVALCQLFGTMMDLPKGWPMYTRDIKQLCDSLGNPTLPEQGKGEHHALADARHNQVMYEFLERFAIEQGASK